MRLKSIVSHLHILIAILILAGLTACGREKQEPGLTNASNPPEKQTRLAGKVSDALKDNIFLKPQGLEVVVIDEKDGFVKLSLITGNRELRKLIAGGADLDSAATEMTVETDAARQSLTALKKAVSYVKTIGGVKAVLVTAEINAKAEQAQDLYFAYLSEKNEKEAVDRLRQSAEMGDALAQNDLGACYSLGKKGVSQDYKEAVRLYRLAAEQGNLLAQVNLGGCYYEGKGVPRDYQEAVKWGRLAAEQGFAVGQSCLAWFLATCPDPRVSNGQEALRYAKMAAAQYQEWDIIGVLGAAHARVGNFKEAIIAAEKSLALLQSQTDVVDKDKELREARERLQGYRNKQPWTEQ